MHSILVFKLISKPMAPVLTHQNPVSTHEFSYSNDDKISLINYSEVANMYLGNKDLEVVGVILADDRAVGKNVGSVDGRSVVLGTVCLESLNLNLEELRRVMCTELPCLPASFNFLSKEGWPIHKLQEHKIKASLVVSENKCVCIKKEFEKPRVGIVTSGGDPVGFIFTDLNVNIKQLRETMEQQLKVSQQMRLDYRFVERNGWPVMSNQETILSLVDILLGQIICIQNCDKQLRPLPAERPNSLITSTTNPPVDHQLPSPSECIDNEPKRKRSIRFFRPDIQPSIKVRKESEKRTRLTKETLVKPILISYVRAEAAQYALDLKQELVSLGFSVYLDVHEIKTGSDWQDALNFAVTNCFLFVPLITPMYGKTVWTNREVKLADVLEKKIIPVNFMEHWPPPCLAIQFASTQYIPWKLQENEHVKGEQEKTPDPRVWDPICLKSVAMKIAESYKDIYVKPEKKVKIERNASTRETIVPQSVKPLLSPSREDYYMLLKDEYENSQKIVISAHPRQKYLAQDLKTMFEKDGHEVWCSVDLFEAQNNLCSEEAITDANSPRMPTIQEGDVFFSQNDDCNSVFDKKSLSLNKETEAYGRRPLSRLMSQLSDISHPSTLSQEKLERLKTFQQKVDQAAVVIVLVSEAYTKSTFSHQQVFYCEHRKRVVLVRCDISPIPKWFRLLMGNDMIMKVNNSQFECVLKARVKRALNPSSSETPKDATSEAKMNYLVNFLKRNLPLQDLCVYIAGSSKLQSQRAEEICKAIGAELAKVERLSLVTGGFYGAADITAKTFYECRENNSQISKDDSVVHILPMHDNEDLTAKAHQNPDGSFEAIPFGKTFFLGDSVKERETVVARLLDTCIVIEGGPGVVHEVEEFIWNDHFVIPIMSTGGAAGGMYGVPVKIFDLPPGVDTADWSVLSEKEASPQAVAKAVVNIIISLKKAIASPTNTLQKSKAILKRKSRKRQKNRRSKILGDEDMQDIEIVSSSVTSSMPSTMMGVFEIREASEVSQSSSDEPTLTIKKHHSWWRRFLNAIKHRK